MLVPAAVPHEVSIEPGGLMVPVQIPAVHGAPHGVPPGPHTLGTEWNDWMLHHFAAGISPLRGADYQEEQVLAGIGTAGSRTLPLPRTAAGRRVALALHQDPAASLTVEEWAARVGVSVSTLGRIFVRETGRSFTEWRLQRRLGRAEDYLRSGYAVGHVAHLVGFDTATGFIRAFAGVHGESPAAWQRSQEVNVGTSARARRRADRELLTRLTQGPMAVPAIPPSVSGPRLYHDVHDLLWVYTGTARARVGTTVVELSRGDALWLPANTEHCVEVDAGSVALPLVFGTQELEVLPEDATVLRIPPGQNETVLFHLMATMTPLRPAGYRPQMALDLFAEYAARQRALTVTMPEGPPARMVARSLRQHPHDPRTLGDWAVLLGTTATELNRQFRAETGRSFTAWRAVLRVRVARDLLTDDVPPSVVARRVGYRHLSGFSRDFSTYLGMSPRAYQKSS